MADEERSAHNERLTDEAATPDATDSGKDSAAEIIETSKALPIDTPQVVVAKVLQELPHEGAEEVATSVVEAFPENATEAKIEFAASVVESLTDAAAAA